MTQTPNSKLKIKAAAEELFQKHGIKRVTVEEISAKAGVSKMTFYKYFPNKKELVIYLWQAMVNIGLAKLDEIEKSEMTFPEKIQTLLKMKEEDVSQMGDQYLHDYLEYVPEVQDFYNQLFTLSMTKFMDFIRQAQEKGEVRKSMRPEFFLAAIRKLMELAQDEKLSSLYPNYTDFALEVNNFMYYGIMPLPEKESQ